MCCPPVDLAHVPRALFCIDSYNISLSHRQGHAKTAISTQNTAIKYIFSRKISPIWANLAVKRQPTTSQPETHARPRARKRLNYNVRGPARPALACVLQPYLGLGDCVVDTGSQKACHAQLVEKITRLQPWHSMWDPPDPRCRNTAACAQSAQDAYFPHQPAEYRALFA